MYLGTLSRPNGYGATPDRGYATWPHCGSQPPPQRGGTIGISAAPALVTYGDRRGAARLVELLDGLEAEPGNAAQNHAIEALAGAIEALRGKLTASQTAKRKRALVETIKRRTSIDDPKALDAFEELLRVFVTRKHELFPNDHRLVGDVAAIETPSGLRIQASHAAAR